MLICRFCPEIEGKKRQQRVGMNIQQKRFFREIAHYLADNYYICK